MGKTDITMADGDAPLENVGEPHKVSWIPVIEDPTTIDNNMAETDGIRFDTSVEKALSAADELQNTTAHHERISTEEVTMIERRFHASEVGLPEGWRWF